VENVDEQAARPRAESRVPLVVDRSRPRRAREVVHALGEARHRSEPGGRHGQQPPLNPDRGHLAVDVDGAPVPAGRRVDLEVDVEPPALVVRRVAERAVQDSDEHSVSVQRHGRRA
jgi:hypothetical protein